MEMENKDEILKIETDFIFYALATYYEKILRYTYTITLNKNTAEDLAHDTFIALIKEPLKFQLYENLESALMGTARKIHLYRKRQLRQQRISYDKYFDIRFHGDVETEDIFIYSEQSEQAQILIDAVKALKLHLRQIIVLYYYYMHTFKMISDLLKIKYTTTLSRHQAALMDLKKYLEGKIDSFEEFQAEYTDPRVISAHKPHPQIDYFILRLLEDLKLCEIR